MPKIADTESRRIQSGRAAAPARYLVPPPPGNRRSGAPQVPDRRCRTCPGAMSDAAGSHSNGEISHPHSARFAPPPATITLDHMRVVVLIAGCVLLRAQPAEPAREALDGAYAAL